MALGGNVEARVLEQGTVDEVESAVYAAFEGSKGLKGTIGRSRPSPEHNLGVPTSRTLKKGGAPKSAAF